MALSDLFAFFTGEAKAAYNEKPYNKEAARKPLLAGIKRARDDFNADKYTKPNRWFSVKNKIVAFHPKLSGKTLVLNGVDENHMPSERFVEFLDLMEQEVNAGEFDEVIRDHGKGNVDVHIGKKGKAKSVINDDPDAEKAPKFVRKDWATLTATDKQKVSALYRHGKNPDGSIIDEEGYNPDAPIKRD